MQCMKDFILIAMKCENACDRTKKCIKRQGVKFPAKCVKMFVRNVFCTQFLHTVLKYLYKIDFLNLKTNSLQVEVSFHFVFQSPVAHQKHNYVVEYRSEENDEVYYCFGAINSQI